MQVPEIKTKEWKTVQLQEVVRVFRGASPRPKGDPRYYGGPIPRVLIEDVTRDGKYVTPRVDSLTEEGAKKSRYLEKGSVVLSCSGTRVAIPGILAIPACIHDGFFGFDSFKELVPEYLYYLFEQLHEKMQSSATTGGVFNNLTTQIMKEMYIELPNVTEQKKIISILGTWDKAIELKKNLIEQKKEQKKGLVQKLLSGKIRLPSFNGKWEIQPIEKVCNLNMGKTPSRNNALYWGKGYSWIAISDMKGKYITKTREQITELAIKESGIKIIPKDSVIMSFKLTIGRLAITKQEMYSNEAIVSFDVKNPEILDSEYLYYYLNSIDVTQYGSRAAKGITLNKDSLKEIMVKIPPFEEQLEIRKILSNVDREIDLLKEELLFLSIQKKALMQQLLTGEGVKV